MTQTEEWEQLQAELKVWREIAYEKHQEVQQLQQEKQVLREALAEAIQAIERLQEHTKDLEKQVEVLNIRVKTLEGQQAKDSHNSNLPPSSDRFVRRPKSLKQKSGKKPGGQPGHPGHHLKPVEQPDTVVVHAVEQCSHCQQDLRTCPATIAERRQVIDLPTKRLWVTEHQVEEKQCPQCCHLTRAPFPEPIKAAVQYGTGIQAFVVALVEGQVVPYARASQLLHDLLGVQLSAGSIASFVTACHQSLDEVERQLKAALVKAPVLHQDETGMRVGTEGWWVHVCSTDRLTHYGAHASRGRVGMDAIGIAPQFQGTSVHDSLVSYEGYASTPALCNVHHLRELTFVEEEMKQEWAKQMKDLLLEMKAEVDQAKEAGHHQLAVPLVARLLRRYDELLAEGYRANPPPPPPQKSAQGKRKPGRPKQSPARNLLDRFSQKKQAVLRFLHDFAVPFDNNQAERDLRMSHPSSKKCLAASAANKGSSGSVAFVVTSQHSAKLAHRGTACAGSRPGGASRSSRLCLILLNR
jgi:transposase